MSVPAPPSPTRRLVALGLVGFALSIRLAVAGAILVDLARGPEDPQDYVGRFTQIVSEGGVPYRDHPVEYPPVTLGAIELIGDPDPRATGTRLVWLSIALDGIVAASLLWGWDRRAAGAYLVGSIPVLGAFYRTLDLVPSALAVAALALVRRGRDRSGGIVLAAATLAKLWPAVLIPGLWVWGRRRALVWSVAALVAGSLAWVAWAGPEGPGQVATQRHSPGWEAESTVGALVHVIGDEPVHIVKDSPRVGSAPAWARLLLLAATAAGVALVWSRARRDGLGDVGASSLACVAVLLFFSPIYSFPYAVWLLPWAAIAFDEQRPALAIGGFAVVALTAVAYALIHAEAQTGSTGVYLVIIVRDVLTGALPVAYLVGTPRLSPAAAVPAPTAP